MYCKPFTRLFLFETRGFVINSDIVVFAKKNGKRAKIKNLFTNACTLLKLVKVKVKADISNENKSVKRFKSTWGRNDLGAKRLVFLQLV
jgi:hypothetical protein